MQTTKLVLIKSNMCNLLLGLLMTGSINAQESLNGSITYITRDQAYIDLGKKAGLSLGDSVQVFQDDKFLGRGIVSQTSSSSSAVEALDPATMTWRIGNKVVVEINLLPDLQPQPSVTQRDASDLDEVAQVFLDSSAYQPRKPSDMNLSSLPSAPTFSGYLSTRLSDRGGDSSGVRESRGSIYGQFHILDLGMPHLDVSTYLRGNRSSRDSQSQTRLYSFMLSYDDPASRVSYLLGRMYHPQFSMLGTIDGVGMTWRSDRRVVALAAGRMSDLSHMQGQKSRNKFGVLNEEKYGWANLRFGIIGETESGSFSRNYLLLGSTARLGSYLRLRGYSELDLDLQNQSKLQSTLSLTRFRAAVNWRPWRSLTSISRYSYRENVIDLLDTAQTEYEKAARHTFNTNISFMLGTGMSISGQVSFRGDDSNRQIKIYGASLSHRNFSSRLLSLNAGGMVMYSFLSEGGRVYMSIGKEVLPWLDVDLYDEIFAYRILGETSFRIRHLPEITLSAKLAGLQRLRLRTRFEQEGGELLYRISLSASRQL